MNKIVFAVGVFALVVALGALFAIPVMLLWNYCLVGAIDGVKEVSFLQAWGLYILANFLFKANVTNKS